MRTGGLDLMGDDKVGGVGARDFEVGGAGRGRGVPGGGVPEGDFCGKAAAGLGDECRGVRRVSRRLRCR